MTPNEFVLSFGMVFAEGKQNSTKSGINYKENCDK